MERDVFMVWNSLESNLQIITLAIQYVKSLPVPDERLLAGLRCERDKLLKELECVYEEAQED